MKKTLFVLMAAGLATAAQAGPGKSQKSLKELTEEKKLLEAEILELKSESIEKSLKIKRLGYEIEQVIAAETRPVDEKVCHIEFLDHDTPLWLLKKYGQYAPDCNLNAPEEEIKTEKSEIEEELNPTHPSQ